MANPILYLDAQWKKGLRDELNAKLQKFKFDKLNVEIGFDEKKFVANMNKMIKQVQQLMNNMNKLNAKVNPAEAIVGGFRDGAAEIDKYTKKIEVLREKIKTISGERSSGVNSGLEEAERELKELIKLRGVYENPQATKADVEAWKTKCEEIDNAVSATTKLVAINEKVNKAQEKAAKAQEKERTQLEESTRLINLKREALEKWYDSLSDNEKESLAEQFAELNNELDRMGESGSKNFRVYNALLGQAQNSQKELHKAIVGTNDVLDKSGMIISSIAKKVATLFSYGALISSFRKLFSDAYNAVKAIDNAMVDLRKVTDETEASYSKFLDAAAEKSVRLGATISDVVQITANWAKLGYSLSEASELSESSIIYMNVSDVANVDEAVQHLTTTIKAFNWDVNDSIGIVDRYNAISNKFAVTADGLGQAMKTAGSSLSLAGNSLDESLGMVTGIAEITGNANEAGNALRTISMRLRGAKAELDDIGEDTEGMITITAKLRDKVKQLAGVDITDANGQLRSTYEVLGDIAEKWEDFDTNTQAVLLEDLAGKTRANQLGALLQNWKQVVAATETASDSTNSALIEQEKYANSVEFKVTQIKAVLQDIYQNILNSDTLKNILDITREVLNVVNSIVKSVGVLPSIFGAIGGYVGKNFGFGKESLGGIGTSIRNTADLFLNGGVSGSSYKGSILSQKDIQIVTKYNKLIEQGIKDNKVFDEVLGHLANDTLKKDIQQTQGQTFATEEYSKAAQVASIKSTLFSAALGTLAGIGISLALKGLKALVDYAHSRTFEGQVQALQKLEDEYISNASELDNLNQKLEENKKRIDEINKSGLQVASSDELKLLQEENTELEAQIKYLEAKERILKRQAETDFTDTYNTYKNESPITDPDDWLAEDLRKYGFDYYTNNTQESYGAALQNKLTDLGNRRNDLRQQQLLATSDEEITNFQKRIEALDEVINSTLDTYDVWLGKLKGVVDAADGFKFDTKEFKEASSNFEAGSNFLNEYTKSLETFGEQSEDSLEKVGDESSKLRKQLKSLANGFSKTTDETSALQKVLARLKSGDTLEEIFATDSELLKNLLTEFPNLQGAISDYSDGIKGAFDLQKEFQDVMYEFESDTIYDKFNNLKNVVKEYGVESYQAKIAMQDIINSSPTLSEALNTLGIKFDVATVAAFDSSDAFIAAALAEAQTTLQSQQSDLSRLQQELSNAAYVARNSQSDFAVATAQMIMMKNVAAMADTEAAIAKTQQQIKALSNLKVSSVKVNNNRGAGSGSRSGSGKGGKSGSGSKSSSSSNTNKSIISETYQNEVDLNEWYIKQSENRQKRMNKETDEYREETAKQYAYYKNLAEKTYDEIQRLQKKGYDENNEEYRDLVDQYNDYLNNIYSTSEDIWDSLNDAQQKELESEIKALEDKQDKLDEQIKAYEDEKDAIDKVIEGYEKEQKAIDKQIDARDEEIEAIQKKQDLIDKEIEKVEEQKEAEEERWEAREKSLDFEIERNNAILELEKQRYDTIKSVKQEQMNLDTQLKASKESYKYLDEETRQLLFNEDDYNDLSNQLTQIAEEATQMYDDYLERLNNVTEETGYELEYITDEFERQYELKMKEYEIAKQELSVAKARKELENVSAERNVAMLVNGQWTWVADPNKVKTAVEAVGKAEMSVTQSQDELEQTRILQALQEANSELTLTKNQEEAESNKILETLDAQIAEFERQIALLDNEIAVIEGIIEGLEKQKEELDVQIEKLEEQQDLIDDQIEGIEKQKDIIEEQIKDIELQVDALKDLVYDFASFSAALENGSDAISQAIDVINGRALSPEILGSFADGGTADFDGLALLHGANGAETILNNTDAAKLYNFIHNSPNLYSDILDRIHIPMANGGVYPTTYGASTNVYVDGVQLSQADSESIVEIFKRVIPIAR